MDILADLGLYMVQIQQECIMNARIGVGIAPKSEAIYQMGIHDM